MKKSMTIMATLVLTMAMLGVRPTRGAGDQPKDEAASVWMKQKLAASQNVLAGLTKADFDVIEKNAKSMIAVGYLEKWVRADTPGYKTMLADFDYANKSLTLAARERKSRSRDHRLLAVNAQLCQLSHDRSRRFEVKASRVAWRGSPSRCWRGTGPNSLAFCSGSHSPPC